MLKRQRYRAPRETWDHDHCHFCWATFMDGDLSAEARTYIAEHPNVLVEGYTTTSDHR